MNSQSLIEKIEALKPHWQSEHVGYVDAIADCVAVIRQHTNPSLEDGYYLPKGHPDHPFTGTLASAILGISRKDEGICDKLCPTLPCFCAQKYAEAAMGASLKQGESRCKEGSTPSSPTKQWQPIETAPKDGNPILLYKPTERMVGQYIVIGWWSSDNGFGGGVWHDSKGSLGYYSRTADNQQGYPAYWMPLPNLPEGI